MLVEKDGASAGKLEGWKVISRPWSLARLTMSSATVLTSRDTYLKATACAHFLANSLVRSIDV